MRVLSAQSGNGSKTALLACHQGEVLRRNAEIPPRCHADVGHAIIAKRVQEKAELNVLACRMVRRPSSWHNRQGIQV